MAQPDYVFTTADDRLELTRLQAIEQEFDPAKPGDYLNSFAIKKAV